MAPGSSPTPVTGNTTPTSTACLPSAIRRQRSPPAAYAPQQPPAPPQQPPPAVVIGSAARSERVAGASAASATASAGRVARTNALASLPSPACQPAGSVAG